MALGLGVFPQPLFFVYFFVYTTFLANLSQGRQTMKKLFSIACLCLALTSVTVPAFAGRRGNIESKHVVVQGGVGMVVPVRCGTGC
jgi:hypothetical protein